MGKVMISTKIEIALEETELIKMLRERFNQVMQEKLGDPEGVEVSKLTLIHQEGKPYVFFWTERKK